MSAPLFPSMPCGRNWLRKPCLILGLALCLTLNASAQTNSRREVPEFMTFGSPGQPADAAALDAVLNEYVAAWRAQDAAAFMALHASDVEWINAYARMFRGRRALGDFVELRLFPAVSRSVSEEEASAMKRISIRYIGPDAAVAHLYTDSRRGVSRNEGEDFRRTHFHLVLAKTGRTWQIVHCAIMDARS